MGLFSKPEVVGALDSSGDRRRIDELERRVATLEARLAALTAGGDSSYAVAPAGVAAAPDAQAWLAEVQELVRLGKKVQAIKVYRERTGVGLKEAKDAVEAMPG
ncbi:ribosomal protein L7/L12 [Nocardioides zeicaulis]|uniref:Ribosomal protein L7/L12 n=1 Tax=Nocardioides zeicaulis TaxID=1776857 RepID=A0ABV6DYD7_9ACTN